MNIALSLEDEPHGQTDLDEGRPSHRPLPRTPPLDVSSGALGAQEHVYASAPTTPTRLLRQISLSKHNSLYVLGGKIKQPQFRHREVFAIVRCQRQAKSQRDGGNDRVWNLKGPPFPFPLIF
jgi:hypothetical protein